MSIQFDKAVIWFGGYVENKLAETETHGKKTVPKYTLDQLLGESPKKTGSIIDFFRKVASETGQGYRQVRN